ncbi:hypothetical protein [Mesorhizobium sp.]|nr:hypothetical protein [Mesorhizobium sp.]
MTGPGAINICSVLAGDVRSQEAAKLISTAYIWAQSSYPRPDL